MHKLGPSLLTSLAIAVGSIAGAGAQDLVLKNASVIDVDAGASRSRQTLHIRNGWIQRVGADTDAAQAPTATVIDLAGRYVMPGLWDMHVHPDHESDLELLIANGVTSARIMFGQAGHLKWRARAELGDLVAPRLFIAGPIIEGPPPARMAALIATEGRRLLRTRDEAVAEARIQKAAGFDYLKVYNNLSTEAYAGLTSEGKRLGMPVVGHVPFEVALAGVLAAKQASIEHLRGYIEPLVPPDAPVQPGLDLRSRTLAWEYADLSRLPPLVQATRAAGVWQCPTLALVTTTAPSAQVQRFLASPEAAYLDPWSRAMLKDRKRVKWLSNFTEADWESTQRGTAKKDAVLLALHRAGVPILAGTDTGPWGFSLHTELELLVQAGLTTREALIAGTRNPAEFTGTADHAGKVASGYQADLLIVENDPLQDIRHTRDIFAVVTRGDFLDRAKLDAMLARIKARNADKPTPAPR